MGKNAGAYKNENTANIEATTIFNYDQEEQEAALTEQHWTALRQQKEAKYYI